MQHPHHVAQAGQLQLGHQQHHVGHPHGGPVGGREALAQVEDQVRVTGPQQTDHALQVVLVDQGDVFHLHRVRQQRQSGGVLGQRTPQERHVEPVNVHGHVSQRVIGDQVQGHVGVAQGQIEVHQGDVVVVLLGQVAAEVDAQAGAAHAAAGADDGNDLRLHLERAVDRGRAVAGCALRPQPLQGAQQFFEYDGLRQEFLGPVAQRLQNRLAVAAGANGEDGHAGEFLGQLGDQLDGRSIP